MGVQVTPIPTEVVSHSLPFPFPILCFIPIPVGFPWDSRSHWESHFHAHLYSEALRYGTCSQGISQFYLHTHTFIHNRNESYLPLPSQEQLVLIYQPRRDGRLSRPWCEVAQAKIRTCNLPIANPTLYHTATSAPEQ